jgi:hypothetical protein
VYTTLNAAQGLDLDARFLHERFLTERLEPPQSLDEFAKM